jgi:ubiquinone biosynthesis accessory factor UbiK
MNTAFLNDLSLKIKEISKSSPLGDLEKNLNALLQGAFTKLELVSREEFDVQADLLRVARQQLGEAQQKLEKMEQKLTELEVLLQKTNS